MRRLILIILLLSQFSVAQSTCKTLFIHQFKATDLYSTKIEIETQVTELLSRLHQISKYSEKKIELLLNGNDNNIKIIDKIGLEKSHLSIQNVVLLANPDNNTGKNLSIFKGDIYFSHYYYTMYAMNYSKERRMPLNKFAMSEPWLKWNEKSRSYSFETSNIVENIVNKLSDVKETIKLYRGTHQSEIKFMQDISKMTDESAMAEAHKTIKKSAFHGFFFTDKKSAAEKWSKDGTVVSIEISKQDLSRLGNEGRLYAGVEGSYFEFMFFDPSTIKSIAKVYQVEK